MFESRRIDDKLLGKPIVPLPLYDKKIRTIPPHRAEKLLMAHLQLRLKQIRKMIFPEGDERESLKARVAQLTRQRQ
jgi:hypothetical protein